jgi:hypothetical protein
LRGAWAPALAVLLLSPAPVLAFAPRNAGSGRASVAWLAVVVVALAAGIALLLVIVALGGLPQVHEWRALLRR